MGLCKTKNRLTSRASRKSILKSLERPVMNYRIHFTNALADVEISSLHEQLHEIFQRILDETIVGVPPQDQVRLVLHSNQLEYSIHFPFMTPARLTTERILAEFERVFWRRLPKRTRLTELALLVLTSMMALASRHAVTCSGIAFSCMSTSQITWWW